MSAFKYHVMSIETFITLLVDSDNPNDEATQESCARRAGLILDNLTDSEMDYIISEVERRW